MDAQPVFSPDGQRIIYVRCNNPEPDKCRWLSASPDGGGEQLLSIRSSDTGMPSGLTWSPDGKRIAFSLAFGRPQSSQTLPAFDVAKNQETPLFAFPDKRITDTKWMPNGRGIVVVYSDKATNFSRGQIGYVSYPDGKFEPLTNDTSNYNTLSLSSDGRTLTTIQSQQVEEVDILPSAGGATVMIPGISKLLRQVRSTGWLSDSELLLVLPTRILRLSTDGTKQSELFSDSNASLGAIAVCGNGHSIVFRMTGHEGNSSARLWRMDADGSNLKRLTDGESDGRPVCSPAGKWVYYFDGKAGRLMRIPLDGGTPEALPTVGVPGSQIFPFDGISRDERMLAAYGTVVDKATSTYRNSIAVLNSDSLSAPPLVIPADPRIVVANNVAPQFTPDSQAIVYGIRGENNVDNLWLQPLDGKPGRQITQFTTEEIRGFGWSPDGKKLAIGRGHLESDVVLIRETSK